MCGCASISVCLHLCVDMMTCTLCVSLFEVGLYVVMFHACASGYVCCFVYV